MQALWRWPTVPVRGDPGGVHQPA